jgi:hypothetical protein
MKPTYDEIQMAAVLRTCDRCRRAYYLTHGHTICVRCRRDEATETTNIPVLDNQVNPTSWTEGR